MSERALGAPGRTGDAGAGDRRWVVVGAGGMLGQDLVEVLRERDERVVPLTRSELDVTDRGACAGAFSTGDVVVNCAAWTAVDDAEASEASAWQVNARAAADVAAACTAAGARLVHVSTDYVFSGDDDKPYEETAALDPRTAYGRTKASGEWGVRALAPDAVVVRTAWLYGEKGGCFPRTIQRLLTERGRADVVDDQFGQPTWTRDVADVIHALVLADAPGGVQHATSTGRTSWFGFARAVAEEMGVSQDLVRATTTDRFPRPARRPASSMLGHEGLRAHGVAAIADWRSRWALAAPSVLASHTS